MRVGATDRYRAAQGVSSVRPAARPAKTEKTAPVRAQDSLSIMGIPENELTPKVREAIMRLMEEVESMREELEQQRVRVTHLEKLADQDTLTPVANRRAFVRELTRTVSFSERYDTASSVIYFDLNGLKALNDTHGHAAGDAALSQVASVLVENVRDSDIVARLGGDEFGVLLVRADEQAATEKAAKLVAAIQADPLRWEGAEIPLTVAFGTYTFRGNEKPGEALAEADKAMYAHKNAGRATAAS